jgi:hypothetical protein
LSSQSFYPYATVPHGVTPTFEMADPDVRRRSDGSWDATDPLLDHVKASVTLEMADDLLVQVLPEPERSNPPLTVLLTALSLESRRREAWSSSWAEATTGPVELMLRRAEWAGAVDIQAVLVRSTDVTSAVDGYAVSAAARLAWSQVDRIIFDEPGQLPPGGRLKIDWVRFSEGNDWLQRCQRQLFALEYADPPRLLLNEDVPAAKLILSSSGTRGRRPRIRDATFMQIVHQAWSSLLISSLTKLATVVREDPENQQDTDTMLAEIEGWRSGVLQDWARWLFPESGDQDTALASLFEHVRTLSMEEIVVRRLPYAISERLETWRGFVGLSREFGVAARPEEVRGVQ